MGEISHYHSITTELSSIPVCFLFFRALLEERILFFSAVIHKYYLNIQNLIGPQKALFWAESAAQWSSHFSSSFSSFGTAGDWIPVPHTKLCPQLLFWDRDLLNLQTGLKLGIVLHQPSERQGLQMCGTVPRSSLREAALVLFYPFSWTLSCYGLLLKHPVPNFFWAPDSLVQLFTVHLCNAYASNLTILLSNLSFSTCFPIL